MVAQCTVIVSTYNNPVWLAKCLDGFANQSVKDFDLIVADDGSTDTTRDLLDTKRNRLPFRLKHVWHKDQGFRKCKILNKALIETETDYFLVTDGDCVPKANFVATHLKMRQKNAYLSGSYFKLPMEASLAVTRKNIADQSIFTSQWLREHGAQSTWHKRLKVTATRSQAFLANNLTPARRTWNGNNSSTWTRLALRSGGFDERMGYGGEDVEFGYRLLHSGVQPIMIRYSTVALHLDHERSYRTQSVMDLNRVICDKTKSQRAIYTPFGVPAGSDLSYLAEI